LFTKESVFALRIEDTVERPTVAWEAPVAGSDMRAVEEVYVDGTT
jgi:hypothetical protein